jgi:hypothetical protein
MRHLVPKSCQNRKCFFAFFGPTPLGLSQSQVIAGRIEFKPEFGKLPRPKL